MKPAGYALLFLLLVAGEALAEAPSPEEQARKGFSALLLVLVVPLLIALFFLIRFLYRHTLGKKFATTLKEDYRNEATTHEKSGRFVSAALVYETKLREYARAAHLYEKGNDFKRAAALYRTIGMTDKAKEMYERDGNHDDAAELCVMEGDYEEAARLYDKAGKKIDAARMFERAGRGLAAVRLYREAGEYRRASDLLEQEGMLSEAAEMFAFSLGGMMPDTSHRDDFYTYAQRLERAGETQKALSVYQALERIDPAFRDVRERVHGLASPDTEELGEGKATLRSFIRSGKIDPRNALKLWVHMLKNLKDAYSNGHPYGRLCPDNVVIDAENAITFLRKSVPSAYMPPETDKGLALDERADIYSAGVVLYEMLTGDLAGLGSVRVLDVVEDLPDWLDELVIRCIRKVREDRYPGIDEIFVGLKELSKSSKGNA